MGRGHFSGLMRPQPGEVLSSWINRGLKLDPCFGEADRYLRSLSTDIDVDLGNDRGQVLAAILGVESREIKTLCYECFEWVMPVSSRRYFCEYCCMEDIVRIGSIYLRKQWGYSWVFGCERHHCILILAAFPRKPVRLSAMDYLLADHHHLKQLIFDLDTMKGRNPSLAVNRIRIDPPLEIGLITQRHFSNVLLRCNVPRFIKTQIADVLNSLLKLILRKRVRPFEEGAIAIRICRRGKNDWIMSSDDHSEVLSKSLDVNVAQVEVSTKMAGMVALGYCLKLPNALKLWKFYSIYYKSRMANLQDYSPEQLYSEILYCVFCDFKPFLDDVLLGKSKKVRDEFNFLCEIYPYANPWMESIFTLRMPSPPASDTPCKLSKSRRKV
jgi:hypothetical protein